MSEPLVDVVIAVHDPMRNVDRALASLADPAGRVRATVVCHGIPAASVAERSALAAEEWVRLVEFADGVRSPAGPFNHGLALATAEYVMIMGSDDYLEKGALNAWLGAARAAGAGIQLAPLRYQGGELLANPLSRPWRRQRLDPVRDRLFHRTAPLGLIRRELGAADSPLSVGMPVGEDLAWSSALWTAPVRIDFDRRHPAYIIGADAPARVTGEPRPVQVVLHPVDALLDTAWAASQEQRVRTSLVAKLLRVNVLGALRARPDADAWSAEPRAVVAVTLARLRAYAPEGFEDLPRADRDLLDAAADAGATSAALVGAIARHGAARRAARLLPRRLSRVFGRESVLRRYARYLVDRGR